MVCVCGHKNSVMMRLYCRFNVTLLCSETWTEPIICWQNSKDSVIMRLYCTFNEPHHEKTVFFAYAKTKALISCAVTAQLISAFVFTTQIVHFLLYLYPKFQASNLLLRLYMPVCVGPGRKPPRPVFSRRASK